MVYYIYSKGTTKNLMGMINVSNTIKCFNCNGTGELMDYSHVKSGICFKCKGTGKILASKVNQTKEQQYKESLEELSHSEKLILKENAVFVPNFKNTYSRKDELKKAGFKYSKDFGWFIPLDKDTFNKNRYGTYKGIEVVGFKSEQFISVVETKEFKRLDKNYNIKQEIQAIV